MVDSPGNIIVVKEIKFEEHTVSLRSDGIIQVTFADDMIITLASAKQTTQAIKELSGGKKCLVLKIAGKYTSAEKDAREYTASQEGSKYSLAEAVVLFSLAQRILGNFYLKFERPKAPTALFTNKDSAVKWLKKLEKKSISSKN